MTIKSGGPTGWTGTPTSPSVPTQPAPKPSQEPVRVLRGDPGPKGDTGLKGDRGDLGPQGLPGRDGRDGINGLPGQHGTNGIDGAPGRDGRDGVDGRDGRPGRDGAAGGRIIKKTLGPLSAGRVVYALEDGEHIDAASALEESHAFAILGVTFDSSDAAETDLQVVRLGEVSDDTWNFTPRKPVFVDPMGRMVQTFDRSWAFVRMIGTAVSRTKVMVDPRPPVFF
jgi:hypothetical protein